MTDHSLGPEHDLIGAEVRLAAACDDPEASAEQIAAAESDHAEARMAYDDAAAEEELEAGQ